MAAYETIGVSGSAARIAPTRPSIMSLGATTSAPASTWLTAVRASSSSVSSFATSPSSSDAAVPVARVLAEADVGEQRQAGHLGPQRAQRALHDAVVVPGARALLVLLLGDAEQQHRPHAERAASSAPSRTSSSTERCAIPSSPSTGRTTPSPGQANSGITTSSSESGVSRTSARSVSVRRRRRRRVAGKLPRREA